jgi:hypothetical protein
VARYFQQFGAQMKWFFHATGHSKGVAVIFQLFACILQLNIVCYFLHKLEIDTHFIVIVVL